MLPEVSDPVRREARLQSIRTASAVLLRPGYLAALRESARDIAASAVGG